MRTTIALSVGLLLAQAFPPAILAQTTPPAASISEQDAHAIGVTAYLYFYPLITMDITRKQLTNVEAGKGIGEDR